MATGTSVLDQKMGASSPGRIGVLIFGIALIIGFVYAGTHLVGDLRDFHPASAVPFILLGVALFIARFLAGLDILDPGIVQASEWRPGPGDDTSEELSIWCALGRKPSPP